MAERAIILGHPRQHWRSVIILTGPGDSEEHSDEVVAAGGDSAVGATDTSQSDTSVGDAVAAPPSPPLPEPPEAFGRLKAYCDEHGLKSAIEADPSAQFVSVEFPNGRSTRTVYVGTGEVAEALLGYPLEEMVFLGEYAAVCSYKGGWIEAAVRAHGTWPRTFVDRRSIFGIKEPHTKEAAEVEMSGPAGLTLRLTEKRGILYSLDYGSAIYLRIESIGVTEHDKAVNLLEDLSNSLFMQIDFRFDSPLVLVRDRFPSRRLVTSRGRLDEDNQLTYPRFSYERGPSSLYWYARSAMSMPLLQFLAFYQCIEFFFPQYSRQETIARIKNILKDPTFDGTKDTYVNTILNATLEGRRGSLLEERKQLGATLRQCVDATALRDFLNKTDERRRYYASDCKKISDKRITLSEDSAIVDQTSERIYDIRCKVVHTKNLDNGETEEMILPFSKEADLLMDDVELIKFLAQRVLIASSAVLRI